MMEKEMKKKRILYPVVGFAIGVIIGFLISSIGTIAQGGKVLMEFSPLNEKVGLGGTIALQLVLSGVLGAVSVGGMLFYEIEKWSLALATGVHYLSIMTTFSAISFALGWFGETLVGYFIAVACETVAFAIIWLFMYFRWKKTVREMNDELKKYKEEREIRQKQDFNKEDKK